MNYKQTFNFLYSQLPMFYRIGPAAYKANLNNTIAICDLLNNPYQYFKTIHIAGTNGKGSVAHIVTSILQSSGYKTGLYTSPHLNDFRERIKINGRMITQKKVCDFIEQYKDAFEKIKPSFFEMTVGLAFNHFKSQSVDIAVIETGLGGRLDSTNIITPILSVITNIGMEHTALLGNTIKKIAQEKAGIIKHKIPVVIGETQPEIIDVFINKAQKENSIFFFADKKYSIKNFRSSSVNNLFATMDVYKDNKIFLTNLKCGLMGHYQMKNIITVLCAVELLNKCGYSISEKNIREGIENVVEYTGLAGRWQILQKQPLIICDVGHNPDGMREIVKQINQTPHQKLHFVLGVVNDKDIKTMLSLLPNSATYYFCKADIPRGLDAHVLFQQAKKNGLKGSIYLSVKDAFEQAKKNASKKDLIFVGGSVFTVAEIYTQRNLIF